MKLHRLVASLCLLGSISAEGQLTGRFFLDKAQLTARFFVDKANFAREGATTPVYKDTNCGEAIPLP